MICLKRSQNKLLLSQQGLYKIIQILTILLLAILIGCKKNVEVAPPSTSLTSDIVYKDDMTAIAVFTGLYGTMAGSVTISGSQGLSLKTGLSADELTLWSGATNTSLRAFYNNSLTGDLSTGIWEGLYNYIYIVNVALEGLSQSTELTPEIKRQLEGEGKFLRAYFYFYLTNLYGQVPLQTSSDWRINAVISQSSVASIYQQIISDLKDAQELLSDKYLNGNLQGYTSNVERVRPTKWAATTLLARTYLYTGKYDSAETQATLVINNKALYDTVAINNVFLKNSKEAIWQLQPVKSSRNTEDGVLFNMPSSGPSNSFPVYLSDFLMKEFELGDRRKGNWTRQLTSNNSTFHCPYKYKLGTNTTSGAEYQMMLRLGELFLIRAEARTQLNNYTGAQTDLNVIRRRAGLQATNSNNKTSLLAAILHERQVELFTELGHRWLDLKRTGYTDAVLNIVTPAKSAGTTWQSYQQLYPLKNEDVRLNQNLIQNFGY